MRNLQLWLALIICLVSGSQPVSASTEVAWPLVLRAQMLRLAEVDWRLRRAAGDLCPRRASAIGVTIDHPSAYSPSEREVLARILRLGTLPQVAAVVPGSPGDLAGLRTGDEIVSIAGASMAQSYATSPDPALFADEVMDSIAALPEGKPATFVLRRGNASLRKAIIPVSLCAARTMLETEDALEAHSDNHDLAITSSLIDFTANDDELALIVGHELAHVIQQQIVATPIETERKADLLGAELAHCAGYDIKLAAAFWPRYRAQDANSAVRLATHPLPKQREEEIRAALPRISCPVSPSAALSTL